MWPKLFLFAIGMIIPGWLFSAADPSRLDALAKSLEREFPSIGHISTDGLARRLSRSNDLILIDVRPRGEFAVSHLPRAIRIRPDASSEKVGERLMESVSGRHAVFYCSVGVRSSRLADRARAELISLGAAGVYNLSGGLFAWHNEERTVQNTDGPTMFIHPFDRAWGKLLSHPEFISRQPVRPDGK